MWPLLLLDHMSCPFQGHSMHSMQDVVACMHRLLRCSIGWHIPSMYQQFPVQETSMPCFSVAFVGLCVQQRPSCAV